ncbi:hypothetical protein IRP63_13905 (plasmid) [Clostridium botulinum]|uniref:homing endonuclease associated repeat-containing protein n=1 Tax=Clostridium botulinum TaxID=1491 RepID=UPI0006A48DF9|nr:hypothetical protein [Clostridium botulinum]KOC56907.1 hypothetical protein ADU89_01560 [Clostridium botulinum]KOC57382.1 hypothetical protein ADU90_06100 [Clostridium botulinum]MCD3232618.1 hypothetical protein [Clostridium botulinum D/C]MCD3238453.1 hypothetical protein [Clostridium botulinum D/C]MCD3266027.1 hypothetical protein [Clostridium botulinum D/C]
MKSSLTNEQILQIIIGKARELNKTPSKRNLGNIGAVACYRFGNWNNALIKAGLKPKEQKNYTQQEIIEFIQLKIKELDRIPTITELGKGKIIKKLFGNYNNALIKAGFPNTEYAYKKEPSPRFSYNLDKNKDIKEQLVKIIQDKANELNRVPTVKDFPSTAVFKKNFGNFTEALRQSNLSPNSYRTKEELLDMLKLLSQKLKKENISIEDFTSYFGYAPAVYQHRFGSWNNALEVAGLDINSTYNKFNATSKEEIVNYYINLCNKLDKWASITDIRIDNKSDHIILNRFGTITNLRKLIVDDPRLKITNKNIKEKKVKYSDEFLKETLVKIYLDNNRNILSSKKLQKILKNNNLPSLNTFYNRLNVRNISGLWEKVVDMHTI